MRDIDRSLRSVAVEPGLACTAAPFARLDSAPSRFSRRSGAGDALENIGPPSTPLQCIASCPRLQDKRSPCALGNKPLRRSLVLLARGEKVT